MNIYMPPQAQKALDELENAGYEAYIVGGCVRDQLMSRVPEDYDVTTSALPEQVMSAFAGERIIPTGIKHGTVTVILDDMPLEITTFRADGKYTDHRHPDGVSFSNKLSDDLCRRDFTINAMAYSPRHGLIDLYGGMKDIEQRCVRCVGDAEKRFEEDALRMLRAVRFASVLGFDIENYTRAALNAHVGDIAYVARERICAELNKAVCAKYPQDVFEECGKLIMTALNLDMDFAEYSEAVTMMTHTQNNIVSKWAALLYKLGAEHAAQVLTDLREPGMIINRVRAAIENCIYPIYPERTSILSALNRMGIDGFDDALALQMTCAAVLNSEMQRVIDLSHASDMVIKLLNKDECFSLMQLKVKGDDMKQLGLSGRAIGEMLNKLLDDVIYERVANKKDELINRAKSMM